MMHSISASEIVGRVLFMVGAPSVGFSENPPAKISLWAGFLPGAVSVGSLSPSLPNGEPTRVDGVCQAVGHILDFGKPRLCTWK